MSWLRIDDGFLDHPKILELSDREFRTWVRVLCYCARYDTHDGEIPLAAAKTLGLDVKLVHKLTSLNMLDEPTPGRVYVHNWNVYNNPDRTGKLRKRRQRERERHVTVPETTHNGSRDSHATVTGPTRRGRDGKGSKDITKAVLSSRTPARETDNGTALVRSIIEDQLGGPA